MSNLKALILDFDRTLVNTDADIEVRKNKKGSELIWDEVFAVIPQYRLYEGWGEVFAWCKDNGVKIGIVSTAKGILIQKTLEYFNLKCDAIVGWQMYVRKPNGKLIDMMIKKLKVDKDDVISIGDSIIDKEMSYNGGVRFMGALWDSEDIEELSKGECLSSPMEIMKLIAIE